MDEWKQANCIQLYMLHLKASPEGKQVSQKNAAWFGQLIVAEAPSSLEVLNKEASKHADDLLLSRVIHGCWADPRSIHNLLQVSSILTTFAELLTPQAPAAAKTCHIFVREVAGQAERALPLVSHRQIFTLPLPSSEGDIAQEHRLPLGLFDYVIA